MIGRCGTYPQIIKISMIPHSPLDKNKIHTTRSSDEDKENDNEQRESQSDFNFLAFQAAFNLWGLTR